ncbi:hypothetical protein NL676_036911 [Syzygium grande]|nr:hypothetical protein NL676_036911 [Syzygium grande]
MTGPQARRIKAVARSKSLSKPEYEARLRPPLLSSGPNCVWSGPSTPVACVVAAAHPTEPQRAANFPKSCHAIDGEARQEQHGWNSLVDEGRSRGGGDDGGGVVCGDVPIGNTARATNEPHRRRLQDRREHGLNFASAGKPTELDRASRRRESTGRRTSGGLFHSLISLGLTMLCRSPPSQKVSGPDEISHHLIFLLLLASPFIQPRSMNERFVVEAEDHLPHPGQSLYSSAI